MDTIKEIAAELISMFFADVRLALSVIFLVGFTAIMIKWTQVPTILTGTMLVLGCITLLVISVIEKARKLISYKGKP